MRWEFVEFGGEMKDGVLTLDNRDGLGRTLQRFPDGRVSIRIQRERPRRTDRQNRFWHGVVIPAFAEHCGNDFADMKDILALELLPREVTDHRTGETRIVPGHTSDLNTTEFNDLIERAQRLGASMGIYIPDPNEAAA